MDERSYEAQPLQRPRWWQGPLLGLLASGAGLAAAELVVGLIQGSSSPVVPVGQVFIDSVPKGLKDWAIEQFGTNDKAALIVGAFVVLGAVGVGVGVLAMRGARAAAYSITVLMGLISVWAVQTRPDPTLGKMLPTIVGTAVSVAVLWYLAPRPQESMTPEAVPEPDSSSGPIAEPMPQPIAQPMGVDRRRFVTGAIGIGSVAVMAGGLGRLLQRRFEVDTERQELALPRVDSVAEPLPANVDVGVDGVTPFVTPNNGFYRIDTALAVPQVSKDDWSLRIHGLVDNELNLSFQDLLDRPQVERYVTLSCVSNEVGGNLVGNALWQGVLLKDVLEEAGLQEGAEQVVSKSVDGWTAGSPTEVIMDGRDAMLAIGMNGEPLPARHGYPVRLVVPGLYGYVSATKWVNEIQLTRWDDFDAYWVPRGWAKRGPVKTAARIDTYRPGSQTGEVIVAGVAWAVHRGISKVEVRVDEGEWQEAELGGVPSNDTWVQWKAVLTTEPGRHRVSARAYDGEGVPQTSEPAPVAPDGVQGYHRRVVDV